MAQFERVLFSVLSILLLILLLRRERRKRSLITYLGFEYEVSEDVLVTGSLITHRRRALRERAALRRQAWAYPRPQEWFEERSRNRNLKALFKKHFRVTRDTFDYICQLIKGRLKTITDVLKLFCYVTLFETTLLKNHDKLSTKQTRFR